MSRKVVIEGKFKLTLLIEEGETIDNAIAQIDASTENDNADIVDLTFTDYEVTDSK